MNANKKFPIPEDDSSINHLKNLNLPNIALLNQEGNYLQLDRSDTFRIVLYFFPMTGRPDMPLPNNWNKIPGASGCTLQTCNFRDSYDDLIILNAVPIGVSTQSVQHNKEMINRLGVQFDVLSDAKLELKNTLNLPTFSVKNKIYLRRLTLIIEKKIVKKVFYPIFSVNKHIDDVLKWLKEN
ncbi:peroxiredoxin [Pelagibacteraceae bacterium]|nr:peroxiredoxin [Pelagibacteraceae bacterium]